MRDMTPETVLEQLSAVIRHGRKLESALKELHELEPDERTQAVIKIRRLAGLLVGAAEEVATAARRLM